MVRRQSIFIDDDDWVKLSVLADILGAPKMYLAGEMLADMVNYSLWLIFGQGQDAGSFDLEAAVRSFYESGGRVSDGDDGGSSTDDVA